MPGRGSKVCVLVSGGVDSSVLVADCLRRGETVYPLYVRCGLLWEKAELFWLRRFLAAMRRPGLKPLTVCEASLRSLNGGHWSMTGRGVPGPGSAWESVYLPGRNLLLISQAALFCSVRGIPVVALGLLKGNPFSDAGRVFLKRMQSVLKVAFPKPLRLRTPYRGLTKRQVSALLPEIPLPLTFSCLRPKGLRHCLRCSKCEERFGRREG